MQTTESVGAVMMSEVRADLGGTTEAIRDVSISELRSGEARLSQIMGEEITPLLSQAAANFRTATSHWWQSALVVADEGSRALKRAIRTAPFTQELGGELAAANPVAELSQLSRSVGILYRGYGLSVGGAYPVFAVYFGAYEASKTAVASWIGGGGERGDGINGVVTGDGVKTMYRRDSRDGSVTVHVHQRGGGARQQRRRRLRSWSRLRRASWRSARRRRCGCRGRWCAIGSSWRPGRRPPSTERRRRLWRRAACAGCTRARPST